MTLNHRMEGLSMAYVEAIASVAGFNIFSSRWDYGIDLTLSRVFRSRDGSHFDVGPPIDVQLKSTTLAEMRGEVVRYALDARTYNDLATEWFQRRVFLLLVVLPESEAEWIDQTESELTITGCGYWLSLRGQKLTKNKRSVTISIPRTNRFSVAALQSLVPVDPKENES